MHVLCLFLNLGNAVRYCYCSLNLANDLLPICRIQENTYPKNVECLLHSCFTLLEQCVQFTLTEEMLDLVSILLCFNKSMYFVKCSINTRNMVSNNPYLKRERRNKGKQKENKNQSENVLCKFSNVMQSRGR